MLDRMRTVQVKKNSDKFVHGITVGSHHLIADVMPESGGTDSGPSPHEYLAAALGACTAITLQMYAQRKQWSLVDAQVNVNIVSSGDEHRFEVKLNLVGSLDDTQKKRLLDIAEHCPVHKTLVGKISIQTELV